MAKQPKSNKLSIKTLTGQSKAKPSVCKKRKVIDAQRGVDGSIEKVKLEGNKNFTNYQKAVDMTRGGALDLVLIEPKGRDPHIRTPPDASETNNLEYLADK